MQEFRDQIERERDRDREISSATGDKWPIADNSLWFTSRQEKRGKESESESKETFAFLA